jgi:hypothetical protein
VRLSKIAHMEESALRCGNRTKARKESACTGRLVPRGHSEKHGLFRGLRVRQVEFATTVNADPLSSVLDREHTTLVTMSATNDKLENPE